MQATGSLAIDFCLPGLALGLAAVSRARRRRALVLIEADTGKVIPENAGQPWYPASVTKLMTTYVTFKAMRAGKINKYAVQGFALRGGHAAVQGGLPRRQAVTVDNALKMLMVKSANDMAVVLAEGVGGDVDTFVAEMNAARTRSA